MRFSTSFATAWFCAACSGAHFGDPHSDFCLTPLQTRSRRRTQLAHGSVTPSWHGGTGHTSAFALGDWGVGPTPSGGRSHGQGMLRKIHSRGFRAYPYESSGLPSGTCHPGRAQIQPSPRGRAQHSTAGDRKLSPPHCKLPRATQGGDLCSDSADQTWHIPNCFQEPGHGHRAPRLQLHPGAFRAQAPGALHKTLDKQQHKQDQKLLTHHKAAEELTPAFSFSSVCFSVKYIIYSSIGLIVIYYSLELLLSFPYFNHIYASNFAYRSYCLEFIIEIHRIKLK